MDLCQKVNMFLRTDNLDKFSYTILIYESKFEEILNQIVKKIENINKKSIDGYKKKKINDRLHKLKTTIENKFKPEEEINEFIILNESINLFKISKKDIQFCKEWNLSKFIFIQNGIDIEKYDGTHESIESFINELISIDKVRTVFKFDKNTFYVNELYSTKTKTLENHTVNDEIVDTLITKHKPIVLYGLNPLVKKLSSNNSLSQIIIYKNLSKSEVIDSISKYEIKENQLKFKSIVLDNINNPEYDEKFLFGTKEVSWGLNNYMVKHLFINPKLFTNFNSSEESKELISNIQVTIVQPLEAGDYGITLNKNYGGAIALKYY